MASDVWWTCQVMISQDGILALNAISISKIFLEEYFVCVALLIERTHSDNHTPQLVVADLVLCHPFTKLAWRNKIKTISQGFCCWIHLTSGYLVLRDGSHHLQCCLVTIKKGIEYLRAGSRIQNSTWLSFICYSLP